MRLLVVLLLFTLALLVRPPIADARTRRVDVRTAIVLSTAGYSRKPVVCTVASETGAIRFGILRRTREDRVLLDAFDRGAVTRKKLNRLRSECRLRAVAASCGDGRDNDADGARDFPADSGCSDEHDNDEGGNEAIRFLAKPFDGEFRISNPFDHDLPFAFTSTGGNLLTTDGERSAVGIDSHDGYDFSMDVGTPILAAASGTVVSAGLESEFSCPILSGAVVAGLRVRIRHSVAGRTYDTVYLHLSRVDVAAGASVTQGTVIGLSGNTGCSTAPHLHFETQRRENDSGTPVDPYGWNGSDQDPWALHPEGLASEPLWKSGSAPILFREVRRPANPDADDNASVAITAIRWMGRRDDLNPNNEFIELSLDPRYDTDGVYNLSGAKITTNAGDSFVFPSGSEVKTGSPVLVYSGSGEASEGVFYWGRSTPAWNNDGDCGRLFTAKGSRMYTQSYGKSGCTNTGAAAPSRR